MSDGIFEVYLGVLIMLGGLLTYVLISERAFALSIMCLMIGLIAVGVGWTNIQAHRATRTCPRCGHIVRVDPFQCPKCGGGSEGAP